MNILDAKYPFVVPALLAALDDAQPQVRMAAGSRLALIGLTDDRTVPALCRLALKADDLNRETVGVIFGQLTLVRPSGPTSADQLGRRFETAVQELRSVVERREAGGRAAVVAVLGRIVGSYEKSGEPALLAPARAVLETLLARIEDPQEDLSLRLDAMGQWPMLQMMVQNRKDTHTSALHATALWIASLGRVLADPALEVRGKAMVSLLESFQDPLPDGAFRQTWQGLVPTMVKAAASDDLRVRTGALLVLKQLGPVAEPALPALRHWPARPTIPRPPSRSKRPSVRPRSATGSSAAIPRPASLHPRTWGSLAGALRRPYRWFSFCSRHHRTAFAWLPWRRSRPS